MSHFLPITHSRLIAQDVLYELKYWHPDERFLVEVHYDDVLNAGLAARDIEGFWARSTWTQMSGIPVRLLSPEDQLVHLCAHMHYHGYTRLNWFSDLIFLCDDQSLDWSLLTEITRKEEAQVPVHYSLHLSQRLLDLQVPPRVLAELKPDTFRRWWHEYFCPEEAVLSWCPYRRVGFSFYFIPFLRRLIPDLLVMGRRGEKFRYLARLLMPPRAWLASYYDLESPRRVYLHYLLHPLKMMCHFWREVLTSGLEGRRGMDF